MGNGGTGILTAEATPETARRAWPRWLALGIGMVVVAVVAVLVEAAGARLLLGALGVFLVGRGVLLRRAGRSPALDRPRSRQARTVGTAAVTFGGAVLGVAVASAELAAGTLLFLAPVALLAGASALRSKVGRTARWAGTAVLAWAALVIGLLVVTFVGLGWERASEVATAVTAIVVAGLGVPLVIAAARLRTIAATPAPAVRAGCAGCACGAGGCGS